MTKRRRPTRLPKWQELTVYISIGLLAATGIAWLLLDWLVRVPTDFGPEPHPAQRWMLVTHGLVAYAALVVIGAMIPIHVAVGWNIGRNLKTGLALAATLALLMATALGLYYLGGETLRRLASVSHWTIGLAAVPVLVVHSIRGRRGP